MLGSRRCTSPLPSIVSVPPYFGVPPPLSPVNEARPEPPEWEEPLFLFWLPAVLLLDPHAPARRANAAAPAAIDRYLLVLRMSGCDLLASSGSRSDNSPVRRIAPVWAQPPLF